MGAGVLYTVFVAKRKDSWDAMPHPGRNRGVRYGYWPLAQLLQKYMEMTQCREDILVSPGYLTASAGNVTAFLSNLDALVQGAMAAQRTTPSRSVIEVRVLRGVNGTWAIGGRPTASAKRCILDYHTDEYNNPSPGCQYGAIRWIDPMPHAKRQAPQDHRKMLFFIDPSSQMPDARVNALTIGSSNFSWQTYFCDRFDKGEADAFMFVEDDLTRIFAQWVEDVIRGTSDGLGPTSTVDETSELKGERVAFPHDDIVISRSVASSPDDPRELLRHVLDELLESQGYGTNLAGAHHVG